MAEMMCKPVSVFSLIFWAVSYMVLSFYRLHMNEAYQAVQRFRSVAETPDQSE